MLLRFHKPSRKERYQQYRKRKLRKCWFSVPSGVTWKSPKSTENDVEWFSDPGTQQINHTYCTEHGNKLGNQVGWIYQNPEQKWRSSGVTRKNDRKSRFFEAQFFLRGVKLWGLANRHHICSRARNDKQFDASMFRWYRTFSHVNEFSRKSQKVGTWKSRFWLYL